MDEWFEGLIETGAHHCVVWADADSGLRALLVIDDTTLGPAAGGTRTQPYPSVSHALADATWLARAMTHKCALAGLNAGGAKLVVLENPSMNREQAFAALGEKVDALNGLFRTGPDLGTNESDLDTMRTKTSYVRTDAGPTTDAVARGVLRGIQACADVKGRQSLDGLRIAIQGCGLVGAAVARALKGEGAELVVADVDNERAEAVRELTGATVVAPGELFGSAVDIVSPCASGGVLSTQRAKNLQAWAVCGGANNILADMGAADILHERGVLHAPDIVSSAGGVIYGIGRDVMAMEDPTPLIDRIRDLTREILEGAKSNNRNTLLEARARAEQRIDAKRAERVRAIAR